METVEFERKKSKPSELTDKQKLDQIKAIINEESGSALMKMVRIKKVIG